MNQRQLAIDPSTPVGQLARFLPDAIGTFEALDIDYACFGGRSVADAATVAGADLDEVLAMLAVGTAGSGGPAAEPSLPDLVHRIITEHHHFDRHLMRELSRRLSPRVHPEGEVSRIRRLFTSLASSLEPHARREERELFPMVEELALHPERVRAGSISRRLFAEFVEHGIAHERLQKIREIVLRLRASGFSDDELLDDIDAFDRMAHRHIHLENNVLIPRVIELENRLRGERSLPAPAT